MNDYRLGLDFGGVIVQSAQWVRGEDTGLTECGFQEQPDAFEYITQLVEKFEGRIWIISKAGPRMEQLTREWLDSSGFYEQTGFNPEHVRFCRERIDKREHCLDLAITHFVDDRIHLMQILQHTVEYLYLFTPSDEKQFAPKYVTHVSSWDVLFDALFEYVD